MPNINNRIEYILARADEPESFISDCEATYNNKIKRVAEGIAKSHKTEIVMLAGPSSAGKTTTAKKLGEELSELGIKCHTVSLDDFYLNNADSPKFPDGTPDFETVYALDIPYFEKTMKDLIEKCEADMPEFDFITGKRKEKYNHLKIEEADVIVVEGLHALNPLITEHLPKERLLKIYINVSSRIYNKNNAIILNKRNLRFIRRLVRDYKFRGNSVEDTFKMWKTVSYGEDNYLFPFKDNADIKINTLHLYEVCVLKEEATALLKEVRNDSEFYKEACKLIAGLDKFIKIEKNYVPETSLLREFIGGKE